jgi:enoyl-CoA hydratase/carnithine racemase
MPVEYRSEIVMPHDTYATLRVAREDGVARVTVDNPPVNVLDAALMADLRHLLATLRDDDSVRVIVFDSADPEFFVAHVDMTLVDAPDAFDGFADGLPDGVNVFQGLGELLRHQPQVTIVKLAGIARGGGAELVTAADMAFAAVGRAGIGQIEALMGIVPGGGGLERGAQTRTGEGDLEGLLRAAAAARRE